jgi:hypothetical protein
MFARVNVMWRCPRHIRTDFAGTRIEDFGFAHDVAYSTYTQSRSGPIYRSIMIDG